MKGKNVRWKESLVSGAGLASGVIGYRLVSISWIIIFNQEEEEKWMMMIIILKTMLMVSDRDFGDDDFHLSLIPPWDPQITGGDSPASNHWWLPLIQSSLALWQTN